MNNHNKGFTSLTTQELDFLFSCVEGVLICGLYKRFNSININIKPLITNLITNGLIYKKENIYVLSKKGKIFISNID